MKPSGRCLATLATSLTLACGSGGGGPTPDAGGAARDGGSAHQVVMVVDDGFDPSVAELVGKVIATYTITCEDGSDSVDAGLDPLAFGESPDFDQAKRDLIAALRQADHSCQLRAGLQPYDGHILASVDRLRDRWNAALRADVALAQAFTSAEYAEILAALARVPSDARVHGTSVAGLLAYQNPDVRLVLVQYPMLSTSEVTAAVACVSQATVDQAMALLADAEVRAAYVSRPRGDLDRGLDDAIVGNEVGSLNLSLGVLPTQAIEDAMVAQGCPRVDLGPWQARLSQLDREQEKAQSAPSALSVQSAGNAGVEIASPADSADCRQGDPTHLLVGAYDLGLGLASFSNHGACVDVLAPGKSILAPIPGDWLLPQDGTSFSAPLVTRLVSTEAPQPLAPAETRDWLVSLRDSANRIPVARFPADAIYDPSPTATTDAGASSFFSPVQRAARPITPGTDAVKLRRLLWILKRLGGSR